MSCLQRDATLAQYMLWPCVCLSGCPSICLSQVGVLSQDAQLSQRDRATQ